ncbi:MAG: ester cyclase [Acidimicrobiia bacterium]|jgi:steroid delta-isomerase-like uncharacterized protein
MDRVIDEHFEYEVQDDVAGVLSTLTRDVDHDVVGSPTGPLRGRKQAQGFYEQMYADLKGESVTTVHRYYGDDFVVDESVWKGIAVGTPFGLPGRGRPLEFRILHVFEFAEDGSIRRENVWMDQSAIAQQLGDG